MRDASLAPKPATVAVVIPVHNEAAHIESVIASVPHWVDRVIVVDDASTDGTAGVLGSLADPRLVVITRAQNGGVGAAMKSGLHEALRAESDIIVKMDGDGQMDGGELARIIDPIRCGLAEYSKGNRFYFRDGTAGMPGHRHFGNSVLSFMTKVASGYWHVFDPQCGFLAVSRPFLELIDVETLADDYFFENDMLIKLSALSARVVDVPVSTIYGAEISGISLWRVLTTFPPRLVSSGVNRFWRKHLVTDFSPIALMTLTGLVLGVFGAAFGAYHWWLSVTTGVVATTGTVMIAVLPLVVALTLIVQALSLGIAASPGAAETAEYVRQLIRRGEFARRG